MNHPLGVLHDPLDGKEGFLADHEPTSPVKLRSDDGIGDAGFVPGARRTHRVCAFLSPGESAPAIFSSFARFSPSPLLFSITCTGLSQPASFACRS